MTDTRSSRTAEALGTAYGSVHVTGIEALPVLLCAMCWQENNFKAVLESIRDLMNSDTVMPPWLHDIFLGYGDPAAAQYTKLPNTLRTIDFKVLEVPGHV